MIYVVLALNCVALLAWNGFALLMALLHTIPLLSRLQPAGVGVRMYVVGYHAWLQATLVIMLMLLVRDLRVVA